jgi:hypothetical protein
LHAEDANVGRLVAKPKKELDRPWRNPGVGKKSHSLSGVQGMELIFGKNGGVREGLTDIFQLEVGKVNHDLGRRHPVGHKIDDVGDGDAQAADRCAASQNIRVLGDAIKDVRHEFLLVIVSQALS